MVFHHQREALIIWEMTELHGQDSNRETWITSRMAHVYSIGTFLGHEGSEALVDAANSKGFRGELHDDKNGGWYAGLDF